MPTLPEPDNDKLKELPNSFKPSIIKTGSENSFLNQNNPNFAKRLETDFLESKLFDIKKTDKENKERKNYLESNYRNEIYMSISKSDSDFNLYLKNLYGSVENFFEMNQDLVQNKTFNPNTDFHAEVVIITEENYYKSDFISTNEVILEMLNGICTVDYFQKDGNISRLNTTLSSKFIPYSQNDIRNSAFGGLYGRRILCWDLVKQKWASFYMRGMVRFVRDETSDLE